MGSADRPGKMDEKLKSENMQTRAVMCYTSRAIRAGRCRERRYADHIFIQIYFRMHHFVVNLKKYFLRLRRQGGIDPPNQNPADVPASAVSTLHSLFEDRWKVRKYVSINQSINPSRRLYYTVRLIIKNVAHTVNCLKNNKYNSLWIC